MYKYVNKTQKIQTAVTLKTFGIVLGTKVKTFIRSEWFFLELRIALILTWKKTLLSCEVGVMRMLMELVQVAKEIPWEVLAKVIMCPASYIKLCVHDDWLNSHN